MAWLEWKVAGPGHAQSDYWRDVICRAVLDVDLKVSGQEAFACEVSRFQAEDARFIRFNSNLRNIVHAYRPAIRSVGDHYMVSLQLAGLTKIVSEMVSLTMRPGDVAVLDPSRPCEITLSGSVQRIMALVPRRLFRNRPLLTRGVSLRKLNRKFAYAGLLRHQMLCMADRRVTHSRQASEALIENLAQLLSLAGDASVERCEASPVTLKDARSYIAEHLTDCDLTPGMIASGLGISVRSLYNIFSHAPLSVEATIIEARLDACQKALQQAGRLNESISSVALSFGFKDLAHFSRRFRMRFGMSPSQWRARLGS